MAKRVPLDPSLGFHANQTERSILERFLRDNGGKPVVIGACDLACDMRMSIPNVRRSIRLLQEKGLVDIVSRYDSCGRRLKNEYAVTELGRRLVEEATARQG